MFALLLSCLVIGGAGCGSDGTSPGTEASGTSSEAGSPQAQGPTSEFIVPGGDNVVQLFGREATPAERREVSAMIAAWMRARAARDWKQACRYVHEAVIRSTLRSASHILQRKVSGCAKAMATVASEAGEASLVNTMVNPVASLRIGEGHGYAQYHGHAGRDWIVPVRREDAGWKISGLAPIDRLK
jgi:hypothetical protein